MSLINDFSTACVIVSKAVTSDGSGGYTTAWTEGTDSFLAAITFDQSKSSRIAEKDSVKSLYTVTYPKSISLKFHDVIKRMSDGKYFRITSDGDDIITPAIASFSFAQVTAEEFKLT